MRTLRKFITKPSHDSSDHFLAIIFGLLFGILGIFSKTEIKTILGQALFSLFIGFFIGLFMALSATNNGDSRLKEIISLGFLYAVELSICCFLVMLVASALR